MMSPDGFMRSFTR